MILMEIEQITNGLKVRRVAEVCGISVQAVYKWEKSGVVPPEYVLAICEEADWEVTPHDLRPDIYPHPSDGMPRSLCACAEYKEAA